MHKHGPHGIVYFPPTNGFPYLAVIFNEKNEVIISRSVPDQATGEALIAKVLGKWAEDNNLPISFEAKY